MSRSSSIVLHIYERNIGSVCYEVTVCQQKQTIMHAELMDGSA